jgi:3-methyladenine DNA glycosylase AlkD
MKAITPEEIFNELDRFGKQHADPVRVDKYARYFKEGYDAYGITEGLLDQKIADLLKEYEVTYSIALNASLALVASPKYEMPAAAFKFLIRFRKVWDREMFYIIEQWFPIGITNWAHTDYICGELMPWLFKNKIIGIADLKPWRTSIFRFQRRAAVVSLIKPMKLVSDFSTYYTFIEPMMHDPERVVHQALGWFLREMWKKQPEPTEAFLMRFKETAPRLIFQYATEKMDASGKERFRRTKK